MLKRHLPPVLAFLLLAAAASPVAAQNVSVEDRLQRLEDEVGALRKENQQLRSELGLEGKAGQTTVRPAGRAPTVSVGGMVQFQAEGGDKGDARFTTGNDRAYLRRARINIQGRFLEEFDFKVEGDFGNALAEITGARAQLTDGYITWNRYPAANVRVGQLKTPFGFEQLYADPRLFTIERSMANDRLTVGRQVGAQVSGDLLDKQVSYATGLFNSSGVNTNANDNDKFMWVGRVSGIPWQRTAGGQDKRVSIGASAYTSTDTSLTAQPAEFGFDQVAGGARDNIFTGRRRAGELDSQLHLGRFDLMGEYLHARYEPVDRIPARRFDANGWYGQGSYFIVPAVLQGVVKFDNFDPNTDIASNSTSTWTFGVNWLLKSDDLKLQLDYLSTAIDGTPSKSRKLITRLQALF